MHKMKDCGLDIVGQMPTEWDFIRLRYLCDITTGDSDTQDADPDGEYPFYVRSPIVERSTKFTFNGEGILMAGDGAGAGRVFHHAFGKYAVHQRVYRLYNFKVNSNFLFYYISNLFPSVMDKGSAQSTVPSVRLPMLLNFEVCFPPLAEQQKIADFLDEKCGEIDSIRSDIQKQIDILNDYKKSVITEAVTKGLNPKVKLKDSGIEWIGKNPEGWCVKKLKYVFAEGEFGLKIGPFGSALKDCVIANGDYKVYNQAHVISNDFSLSRHFVSEESYNRLYSYRVLPDDILFSMMGTIGKCRIMPRGYPKGIMDSHLLKARLKNFILPSFFQYVYDKDNSTIIYTQLEQYANGTIMNGLNSSIIKKLIMPVPPLAEQKAIADYLDEKCSEIDATIADKQKQLETLDEYKKSLIFEYVTGKKECV